MGGNLMRITRVIHFLEKSLVSIFLFIILFSMFLQVIYRYWFGVALTWPEALGKFSFVWMSFIGAAIGVRKNAHVRIDELINRLPERVKNVFTIIIHLVMLVILMVITVCSWDLVLKTTNSKLPGINVPVAYMYLAVPVCTIRMIISYC